MRATQQFLESQIEVTLMFEKARRMAKRMNQPRCRDAEFSFLIAARYRVRFFEPLGQRRIIAIDQLAAREEAVAKCGPSRPFHHALEPTTRNQLDMKVDSFFDQRAENAWVLAIGSQALGDAILFDQPQRDRVP